MSGKSGAEFVASLSDEIPTEQAEKMLLAIDEYLLKNRPVQHIIGYSYFYGYKMKVSEDVLIPRPETEELVGYVLAKYDEIFMNRKVKTVDIGTGSGAIAIALAKEEPNMEVYASDISENAIIIARENANNNNAKVSFTVGNMLEPYIKENAKFDILVSNPPYIPDDEYVESIVLDNEPHIALFGGNDGMHFYDIILKNAHKILNVPNVIAFEHSFSKRAQMELLVKKYFPKGKIEQIKDLNGKDRFTIITNLE